jgi:hypothetical protein
MSAKFAICHCEWNAVERRNPNTFAIASLRSQLTCVQPDMILVNASLQVDVLA